jgi:hypothetical protein
MGDFSYMYVYLNVERYTSRKREMRSVGHQTKDKLVCGELDIPSGDGRMTSATYVRISQC